MSATPVDRSQPLSMFPGGFLIGLAALTAIIGLLIAVRGFLPLATLTGAALIIGLLARPRVATLLFMTALYLNLPVIASTLYGVPPLLAAGFVSLLGIPFAGYLLRGSAIRTPPAFTLMIGLLGTALLSALQSRDPSLGIDWIGVYAGEGLLLVFLTVNVVRTRRTVTRTMWALVLAGGFLGGLSLFQDATNSFDTDFGGLAQITGEGFTVDADPLGEAVRQQRLSGPIGEQNRYAQTLLVLLPLAVALMRIERRRAMQALAGVAGGLILVGTLLTFSRGAAIAVAGMIVIGLLLRFLSLKRVIAIAVIVLAGSVVLAPAYFNRVATLANLVDVVSDGGAEADGALTGRAALNLAAWRTFVEHPVVGVGPNVFAERFSARYASDTGIRHFGSASSFPAHNLYLGIAADLGLLGLSMFFGIVVVTAVGLWRHRRENAADPVPAIIATGWLLALSGYLISGMFLHLAYERYYWVLVALASATVLVLREDRPLLLRRLDPGGERRDS